MSELPPPASTTVESVQERRARFCRDIIAIVNEEPQGYAPLRRRSDGNGGWQAAITPPGFYQCRIEGSVHPSAAYVCRGGAFFGSSAEPTARRFSTVMRDLDQCFERSIWYPRDWNRGQVFDFARGERQVTWRDSAHRPRPAVDLKVEEDLSAGSYFLRLAVRTVR